MILELKAQIDATIEFLLSTEENRWIIYGKCKEDMQNYEMKNKIWFNTQDWKKYIDYITDKLEI